MLIVFFTGSFQISLLSYLYAVPDSDHMVSIKLGMDNSDGWLGLYTCLDVVLRR